MESENRKIKKTRVKRRRTKQSFMTKRFKFAEDLYIYYWEAAIVLALILLFFIIFISLYIMAWMNYTSQVQKAV